jgi:glycosyltransferase involved in cell wall biosynthesis
VRVEACTPAATLGDYFLSVGRLIPYKRIDLLVQAFNVLGLPLLIVGEGRDRSRLEAMAKPNVRFLGRLPDAEVRRLLAGCRAFLFPGLEDFGIAPVEAQAAGRPVIAYGAGGALDTVIDGKTGLLFGEQTVEAVVAAVRRYEALGDAYFDPAALRRHALRFSAGRFREELGSFVDRAYEEHRRALAA